MTVSLDGDFEKREAIVEIVNAVTDAYLDEVVGYERTSKLRRLNQLEKLNQMYEADLQKQRDQTRETARKHGANDADGLDAVQRSLLEQDNELRRELRQLGRDLLESQFELRSLRPVAAAGEAGPAPEPGNDRTSRLQTRITFLEAARKELSDEIDELAKKRDRLQNVSTIVREDFRSIDRTEGFAERIRAEAERLRVELDAPPRVRRIQEASVAIQKPAP
jgi:DNA repair exonuclease SbcCD ATPase subunit